MRRTLTHLLFAAGLSLAGASLIGCKQNEGERCEVDNDCSAGLTCTKEVCSSGTGVGPVVDASTADGRTPDVSPAGDGSADQSIATDATSADGAGDGAAIDGATDAPVSVDLASDAPPADAAPVTPDTSSN